jgi:hypothetical protein
VEPGPSAGAAPGEHSHLWLNARPVAAALPMRERPNRAAALANQAPSHGRKGAWRTASSEVWSRPPRKGPFWLDGVLAGPVMFFLVPRRSGQRIGQWSRKRNRS